MSESVRRGDIFLANLDPTVGVEIKKTRPVVVVSNDPINQYSHKQPFREAYARPGAQRNILPGRR